LQAIYILFVVNIDMPPSSRITEDASHDGIDGSGALEYFTLRNEQVVCIPKNELLSERQIPTEESEFITNH
jgi:hypothetical protein